MSSAILDASALLAFMRREPGSDKLAEILPGALISAVNLAEVYSKTKDKNMTLEAMTWIVQRLRLKVVPFDAGAAQLVGSLREPTRAAGLSLGDRAALALGLERQLPVVTTDLKWQTLNLGVTLNVIR